MSERMPWTFRNDVQMFVYNWIKRPWANYVTRWFLPLPARRVRLGKMTRAHYDWAYRAFLDEAGRVP